MAQVTDPNLLAQLQPPATGEVTDPALLAQLNSTDGESSGQPVPDGFTDPQKQELLDYIPKAKDAADLAQYASTLTGGKVRLGNAQQILDAWAAGGRHYAANQPAPVDTGEPVPQHEESLGGQFLTNLKNDIAGIAQGVAGLPDMLASGTGKAMSVIPNLISHGLESAGHAEAAKWVQDHITHNLANPVQVGNTVENISPTPDTTSGRVNRFVGQMVGGVVGFPEAASKAVVDKIVGEVPKVIEATTGPRLSANQQYANAASRQGVDYMAADLPSATKSKFLTSLSSLTFGGIPLAEQGAKNVASAASAADRVASDIGSVADRTGAGQAAQSGARQFVENSKQTMGDLYNAIPIADNAPADISNTRSALTNLAHSFQSNPKLAAALQNPQIARFLDAMTPQTTQEATGVLDATGKPIMRDVTHGGGLSWSDLKDFRTRIGEIIGQPGLASDGAQLGQLRSLYGALSDDMQTTAQHAGSDALNAFNRANTFARARSNRINNVVSLILGPNGDKAPQTAFEALQRLGNLKGGDPIKLAQALRSMPEDEANTVRATIMDDLGRASSGQQNATGDVFSPAQFVTNWNNISERAKNILFTGDHRQALDDLAQLFSGMKSSTKFANSSKTGASVIAATHTVPAIIANPVLGAMDVALQYGGGKLLASPAFARRVASTPRNLAGARAFWSRPWVQQMQLKNPSIGAGIQAFKNAFLHASNDNASLVSSAAASQPNAPQDQQQP